MSGPLPIPIASAAQRMAHVAKARALLAGHKRNSESQSQPGKTWAAIDIRTRAVIVMLSSEQPGDPRAIARQPWGSYTDADQCRMAATARELLRELRDVASLY